MNESITWVERINCGTGLHDVEFMASPLSGVSVSFNPCSKIPKLLRQTLRSNCESSTLELELSQDFQGKWFGLLVETDPFSLPHEVMDSIELWQCNQLTIARRIFSKCPTSTEAASRKVDPLPAIWAKLILMLQNELELADAWLLEQESSCKGNFWLSCLLTACCLKRTTSSGIACRLLEHQQASLHPTLRFNFELQIAMQGTKDSLHCMLKLLSLTPTNSFRTHATKICLREMLKRVGFEETIQVTINGLIDFEMIGPNFGGLWFSIFHSLNFGSPKQLLDLIAITTPRTVIDTLAYVLFSEQYLQRYRGELLSEINRRDFPGLKSIASSLAS